MLAKLQFLEPQFPLTWRYHRYRVPSFEPEWHFHPEFELTAIVRGDGTRLVGDSVEDYQPGDLVLLGPDLPHTYASSPDGAENEAIVIHFGPDFLGAGFFDAPAFAEVATMLSRAALGLRFPDPSATPPDLDELSPAERTAELLRFLVRLSGLDAVPISTGRRSASLGRDSARRIEKMVALIHQDYRAPLSLADIAAAAHMNPSAASRLFARCSGSTISGYVSLVRVNAACRLLRDTDDAVASIAGAVGFGNLSNFNRRFREQKGVAPRAYRSQVRLEPRRTPR